MKAKHVFLTLGLSLAMGLSVGAAVMHSGSPLKQANAWSGAECGATWYIVGTINGQNWDVWNSFTLNGDRYEYVFDDASQVEFKLKNVQSWSGDIEINAGYGPDLDWAGKGWTNLTNNNGGNFQTKEAGKYCVYYDKNITTYENGIWAFGIEKVVTKYSVNVHVGEDVEVQQIAEGALPATPHYAYGKKFDGWYSNSSYTGAKVEGVTNATTDLYGRIVDANNVAFVLLSDSIRDNNWFGSNRRLMLYAFNEFNEPNAAWPGTFINPLDTVGAVECYANIAENAKFILSSATKIDETTYTVHYQTIDIDLTGHTSESGLVVNPTPIADGDDAGKYTISWRSELDEPATEGYYICGIGGDFSYSAATKMDNTSQGGNVARKMNFTVNAGDEIRVRSFYKDRNPWDQWSEVGNVGDDEVTFGEKVGDNFHFTTGGDYDIYAKYVEEPAESGNFVFKFFVAEAAVTHNITLTAVLFEGNQKITTEELGSELAYAGGNYEYTPVVRSGYYARGVFENENCTTAYVPKEFNADGHLYVKYTKLGYYVTGDATFTGSSDTAWKVDGATMLTTVVQDPNNMLEGTVTIPAFSAPVTSVKVKALEYIGGDANNGWDAISYTMPSTYSFVSLDGDSNFVFTKSGTFAVYVNHDSEVYINEGAAAFYTKFLNEIDEVCSGIVGGTKQVSHLQAVWTGLATTYDSLSATEKATIVAKGYNGGNYSGSDLEKVIARYHYVLEKYGTAVLDDFIWDQTITPSNSINVMMNKNNAALIVTLVSVTTIVASAALVMFLLKKKKYSK